MKQVDDKFYYQSQVLKIRDEHFPGLYVAGYVSRARKFIDENYCSEIDLQTVSGFSFLSKFHFTRLFKRCYGRTPHQYLTEKRIGLAKKLLASDFSVAETCYRVGYQSPNSFSAVFKKYAGCSPSEYQKKQFSIDLCRVNVPVLWGIK